MRIVRPYARAISLIQPLTRSQWEPFTTEDGESALRIIEARGRISHRSEESQTSDSWKRLIKAVVIDKGDWSIVEHISVTADMLVDRGVTHELVRHRLASYTQESTRFVNYEKKMPPSFIYPKPEVECSRCLAGDEAKRLGVHDDHWSHETSGCVMSCPYDETWLGGILHAENVYRHLMKKGWRPQEARSVFPNALASRVAVTTNLRNWRHLFIMRTTVEAHPSFRQVMIPLLAEFQVKIPLLFDDIAPNARQVDNLKLPR